MSIYGDSIFVNENSLFISLMESVNAPLTEGVDFKAKFNEIKNKFIELIKKIIEKIKKLLDKIKGKIFKNKVKSDIEKGIKKEAQLYIVCNFGNLDSVNKYIDDLEDNTNKVEKLELGYIVKGNKDAHIEYDYEKTGDEEEDLFREVKARADGTYHIEGDKYKEYCSEIANYIKNVENIQEEIKDQFKDENWFNPSNNISVYEKDIDAIIDSNSKDIEDILNNANRRISYIKSARSLKQLTASIYNNTTEKDVQYGLFKVTNEVIRFYGICINALNIITNNIFKYKIKDQVHNVTMREE